jgi:hypothetical protein
VILSTATPTPTPSPTPAPSPTPTPSPTPVPKVGTAPTAQHDEGVKKSRTSRLLH